MLNIYFDTINVKWYICHTSSYAMFYRENYQTFFIAKSVVKTFEYVICVTLLHTIKLHA